MYVLVIVNIYSHWIANAFQQRNEHQKAGSEASCHAVSNNHVYPSSLVTSSCGLCFSRWFHGKISREQAETLLQPREDGLFLVRESTNYPGDYTLCVSFQTDVQHYRVIYKDNKLTIDEEEFFSNLAELVEVGFINIQFM